MKAFIVFLCCLFQSAMIMANELRWFKVSFVAGCLKKQLVMKDFSSVFGSHHLSHVKCCCSVSLIQMWNMPCSWVGLDFSWQNYMNI